MGVFFLQFVVEGEVQKGKLLKQFLYIYIFIYVFFFFRDQLQVRLGSLTLAKHTPKHPPKTDPSFAFFYLRREVGNTPRNRPAKHTPETNFPVRHCHSKTHPCIYIYIQYTLYIHIILPYLYYTLWYAFLSRVDSGSQKLDVVIVQSGLPWLNAPGTICVKHYAQFSVTLND